MYLDRLYPGFSATLVDVLHGHAAQTAAGVALGAVFLFSMIAFLGLVGATFRKEEDPGRTRFWRNVLCALFLAGGAAITVLCI